MPRTRLIRALTALGFAMVLVAAPYTASAATPVGCALAGSYGVGPAAVPVGGSQAGGEICTFTATGPVSYVGLGFWVIAVTHADATINSDSGAGLPNNGTLAAASGDTVTAQVLSPGGILLVGNASAG